MLTTKMMLRQLRGRKLSIALSSFIIAWALAMMIAGLYSSEVIETSASISLEDSGMPDLFVSLYESRSPDEVNDVLSQISDGTYSLRLREAGQVIVNGTPLKATIIGIDDPTRTDICRLTVLEGRLFESPYEGVYVAGGKDLSGAVQLIVGGSSIQLNMTGQVRSPEYLFNELQAGTVISGSGGETIIFVPLSTLQSVSGDEINDIVLMLADGSRDSIIGSLAALPVSSMTFREDHPTTVFVLMGADKMAVMLPSISAVFVLIGAVSIFITMYRLVVSDSRNIGVLMSLGVRRRHIATSYLGFGMVTLLFGGAFGCLLGYAFTVAICSMALQMMGGVPMVLPFYPAPFLVALFLTAAVVMAAVLAPVAAVLRKDIRSALSYVPKTRVWAGGRSGRSLSVSLGARNLLREPKRTIAVVIAVGLSVGAAGSWLVMLDSSLSYVDEQSSSYLWDVSISLTAPVDADQAVDHFTGGGVTQIMPYVTFTGLAWSGGRSAGAVMTASPNMSDIRAFELRSGSLDFNGAVVANKLAGELGVSASDQLTFVVGGSTIELTVTGVIDDIQTNAVYTSNKTALAVTGGDVCQGVFVTLRSSELTDEYIASIIDDPWVAGAASRQEAVGSLDDLLSGAVSLFQGYFVLNLLIALAVATSAIVVSTSERDLEFATLSSLGTPRSFVLRSLMVEVGLLALLSALAAVPFAFLLAQGFAVLMEESVFYIPIALSVASALTVLVLGWLFIWPSVMWPIRRSKKIDLVRTLRERLQ